MLDPLIAAAGTGLLGSAVAGRAAVYGLDSVPSGWRRQTEWLLIGTAAAIALTPALVPGLSIGPIYIGVLAALPGFLAFLAWRTLLASTLISLLPVYFIIAEFTQAGPTHTPFLALDRAIPLQPAWTLVYASLGVFVVLLPVMVVRERELLRRTMQAYLTVMVISYLGFVVYPTIGPRPSVVAGTGFGPWGLRLLYSLDAPYGCWPSLHVAYAVVAALACSRVHRGVGIAAGVWAALIAVSTLFTKQHYVVDVIAGVMEAAVAGLVFLRPYPREAVPEPDRRRAALRSLAVAAIFGVMVAGLWGAYLIQR